MQLNAHQRLAGIILGQPVVEFLGKSRAQNRSWRLIARDLYEATGGQIDVTPQTLRNWEHGSKQDCLTRTP